MEDGVAIHSTSDWSRVHTITDAHSTPRGIEFSENGQYLAHTQYDNLSVYSVDDWSQQATLTAAERNIWSEISFSPNASRVAFGEGSDVYVYDATDWTLEQTLPDFALNGYGIEFSPNGEVLAYASDYYNVSLYDVSGWTLEETLSEASRAVLSIDFLGVAVSLNPGAKATKTFTWPTESGDAGTHTATVSSQNDSNATEIRVLEPASFDVDILDTNEPVMEGETLLVNATVTNTGNESGQTQATYRVDGTQRGTQMVQLGAGNSMDVSFDLDTSGLTSGNHTHGVYVDGDNATATLEVNNGTVPDSGPVTGMPPGVEAFTNTTALTSSQVSPNSLAGKIRVESAYASNTTIDLEENSTNSTSFNVTVTGHAENVTFFFQTEAIAASQNVSNVTAMVDGKPIHFGLTNASGSSWVGIEVDHFSSRTVTFSTNESTSPPSLPALPGAANPPADLDGDALLEDVDGDGNGNVFDALTYYNNRNNDTIQNNPQQFDYDGDGTVGTVFDAIELYNKVKTL
jgi:hypothetical protein